MSPPPTSRASLSALTHAAPATNETSALRHVPRVLVVDDNPDIMTLMRELLETEGYAVVTVADAAQAEAEIRREPPDLILSDVIMPGKSGYELCRELKADPATRLIPFVLSDSHGGGCTSLEEATA